MDNKTKNNCCSDCAIYNSQDLERRNPQCFKANCTCHKEKGCCDKCHHSTKFIQQIGDNKPTVDTLSTCANEFCDCHNPIKLITNECIPCKAEAELDAELAATIEKLSPHTCHKQTERSGCDCLSHPEWFKGKHCPNCPNAKENRPVKGSSIKPEILNPAVGQSNNIPNVVPHTEAEKEKQIEGLRQAIKADEADCAEAESWEEEFAQFFDEQSFVPEFSTAMLSRDQIKAFIHKVEEAAYERGRESYKRYIKMREWGQDAAIHSEAFEEGKAQALDTLTKKVTKMKLPEKRGTYGSFDEMHIQSNIGYNTALSDVLQAMKKGDIN